MTVAARAEHVGSPLSPPALLRAGSAWPQPRVGIVGEDQLDAAGTDVVRSMAERAGPTITEVEGSHVVMISQPQAVTDVILNAVTTVG